MSGKHGYSPRYKSVVQVVVSCLIDQFKNEGVRDLTAEEIAGWLQNMPRSEVDAALENLRVRGEL